MKTEGVRARIFFKDSAKNWKKFGKKSSDFLIFLKIALMEVTKAGAIQNTIPMLPKLVITPTVLCLIVFAPLMGH